MAAARERTRIAAVKRVQARGSTVTPPRRQSLPPCSETLEQLEKEESEHYMRAPGRYFARGDDAHDVPIIREEVPHTPRRRILQNVTEEEVIPPQFLQLLLQQ